MPSYMPALRTLVFATAIALVSAGFVADAQTRQAQAADIEQQMSPAEFKAAGLEKLNSQELAALNRWLQNKVVIVTTQAVEKAKEEGRQEVIVKNRGFFDFGSKEPIESSIVGEFSGFGKGKRYVLENGQEWEQTEPASLPGVRKSNPVVKITPGLMGAWYLQLQGHNTLAKVRRVK